jgi:hypothetical protein
MIAKVFHAVAAEPATAVYSAHPGDANAHSDGQIGSCAFHHLADDLMSGDNARPDGREIALDDVKIGAADTTSNHLEQHLSGLRMGLRKIFDRHPTPRTTRSGIEYGCFHREASDHYIILT